MIVFDKPKPNPDMEIGVDLAKGQDKTVISVEQPKPVRQSLFSIQMELEDIFMEIEDAGGEVNDEILAKLQITQENFKQKLDSYRKAYSALTYEVEAGKKEKTRLDGIIKTRQNNADKLKKSMYEAVAAYGDTGKSGNKVVNLVDAKLYTKKTEVCVIDEQLLLTFKDLVLDQLRELWDNDMLIDEAMTDSIDPQGFIDVINAKYKANNPESAERLQEKMGHLFTVDDLDNLNLTVEFETSIVNLLSKPNFGVMNTYFDCEHFANVTMKNSSTANKAALKMGSKLTFADLDYTESLIIK